MLDLMEFKKLYSDHFFRLAVIIALVMNLFTTYYVLQDKRTGEMNYSPAAYRSLNGDLKGMGNETAYHYLKNVQSRLFSSRFGSIGELSLTYTDNRIKEARLIDDVIEQYSSCIHYQDYLNDLDKRFSSISDFFASEYDLKNIPKTVSDHGKLSDLNLRYDSFKGIALFSSIHTTDVYVVLFIIILIVYILVRDREASRLMLYKTTASGRKGLACSKIRVILLNVLLFCILMYGSNLVLAHLLYDLGDLSRPIQTIKSFISCSLCIDVLQYLVYFFIFKLMILSVIALIIFLIAVCIRSNLVLYLITVICFGAEAFCYIFIRSTDKLWLLKSINLIAFFDTGTLVGVYNNINILGRPVSYPAVFVTVSIVLSMLSIWYSVIIFDCQQEALLIYSNDLLKRGLRLRTSSLFLHELYKAARSGGLFVILLLYCAFIIADYKPAKDRFYHADDIYYDTYIEALKGKADGKALRFIETTDRTYTDLENKLKRGTISPDYYNRAMNGYDAFVRIRDVLTPYLRSRGGEYLHDTGYRLLTGDDIADDHDIKLGLLAILILIYPLSYIYGIEHQTDMIKLIRSTEGGRKKLFFTKITIAILSVSTVFIITYLPFYLSVLSDYGTESINAPAISLMNLSALPVNISIFEYLVIVAISRYIGFLTMIPVLFFVSSKLKSVISTCVLGLVIYVLPLTFVYLGIPYAKYLLFNPFILGNIF